jgi:hypothetical protein
MFSFSFFRHSIIQLQLMIASNHYEGKGSVRGRDSGSQFIDKKKIKNIKNESKLTQNKHKKKKKKKDDNSDNDDDNNSNKSDDDNDDNSKINHMGDDNDECNGKSIERRDQSFSSLHSVAKLSKAKLGK